MVVAIPIMLLATVMMLPQISGSPPNILLYVIDDLGWGDLSLKGLQEKRTAGGNSEFTTPNIDSLASKAIVLDNYYVNYLCSPTRTSLLSGRYAYNLGLAGGVITNGHAESLRLNESTIAEALKKLGYQTTAVGKWDAGYTTPSNTPVGRGFDNFFGYYNADEDYYTHSCGGAGAKPSCHGIDLHNDTRDNEGNIVLRVFENNLTYSTFLYTHYIERTIMNHDSTKGPFFIYGAYQAVHGPLEAPEKYLSQCTNIGEHDRHIFCGMIKALDDGIGNITERLIRRGFENNTIIVFTTDNGGQNAKGGNNWPLRGNKATAYEGGVRGTGFVWGRPITNDGWLWRGLSHNTDWLPTLVSAAGGKPPSGKDGVDIWDALRTNSSSPRNEVLLQLAGPNPGKAKHNLEAAIRIGKWKLVKNQRESSCPNASNISGQIEKCGGSATGWVKIVGDGDFRSYKKPTPAQSCEIKTCLFDLDSDPTETTDLSAKFPDVVSRLDTALQVYNVTQIPNQKVPFDQAACPQNFNPPAWMPWRT